MLSHRLQQEHFAMKPDKAVTRSAEPICGEQMMSGCRARGGKH